MQLSIFFRLWTRLLKLYDNRKGIKWSGNLLIAYQSNHLWGAKTGQNPTDRGKLGCKRHILTDEDGIPISIVIIS
jgi:putative transposase